MLKKYGFSSLLLLSMLFMASAHAELKVGLDTIAYKLKTPRCQLKYRDNEELRFIFSGNAEDEKPAELSFSIGYADQPIRGAFNFRIDHSPLEFDAWYGMDPVEAAGPDAYIEMSDEALEALEEGDDMAFVHAKILIEDKPAKAWLAERMATLEAQRRKPSYIEESRGLFEKFPVTVNLSEVSINKAGHSLVGAAPKATVLFDGSCDVTLLSDRAL